MASLICQHLKEWGWLDCLGLARPLSLFVYPYIFNHKILLVTFQGLPSLHRGSWTSLHWDWCPRKQTQKLPHLLRPGLELAEYHSCHIRLVGTSQKSSPESKGEERAPPPDGRSGYAHGVGESAGWSWLLIPDTRHGWTPFVYMHWMLYFYTSFKNPKNTTFSASCVYKENKKKGGILSNGKNCGPHE